MKNYLLIIIGIVLFANCTNNRKEEKVEFIESKVYKNVFLLKNLPEEDSLIKKEINRFLAMNSNIKNFGLENKRDYYRIVFYKYTNSSSYFLENEEYEGFESKVLSNDDKLGAFIINKCENDTARLVGELFFYGLKGANDGQKQIDTLIYKCE
ncbi:MAG TPA: hypothetical protein VFD91_13150 [Mariniphaga sp.]|nr:hypothetical protein [Mariniphaga sp.]